MGFYMLNIRETSQKQGLRGNTSCAYARECLFQDSPRPESALQLLQLLTVRGFPSVALHPTREGDGHTCSPQMEHFRR